MSIKKPNEMRSILLKGFGYALLGGRRFERSEKRQSCKGLHYEIVVSMIDLSLPHLT
jgi:hypothetical protein